jgi:hypothetical protein
MKKLVLGMAAAAVLSTGALAAGNFYFKTKVTQIFSGDNFYGGTMFLADRNLGGGCGRWISLDTAGIFLKNKEMSNHSLKLVMLAQTLDKPVNLMIYPNKKVTTGGRNYCVGSRVHIAQ